ncbi:peptidylprolyl isomerase [Gemmatimonadota bacterium]
MKLITGIFLLLSLSLFSDIKTDAQQTVTLERQEIDGIAAIVGEEIILNSEVFLQYQLVLQERGVLDNSLTEEERTQFLSSILDQLIDRAVIVEQARIDSIVVSRSEVEAAIDEWIRQVKLNMGGEASFLQQLQAEGMTEQELRNRRRTLTEKDLLQARMMDMLDWRPGQVSRRQAEEFLLEVGDELMILRSIFLEKPDELDTDALGLEMIAQLRRRIVEDGEDFAVVAREHSADPGSRPLGGDLGSAPRGNFVPSIDDAVWSLPIGEVSEPIQSQFGWHLVQVLSRDQENAHSRHILIAGVGIREALADKIGMIESALAGGEPFEDVAVQFSDAESVVSERGYYALLPKAFNPDAGIPYEWFQALEVIDPGDWTEPLETPEGVFILQLLAVDEVNADLVLQYDFSTVQLYIHGVQQQDAAAEWLRELRSRTYIEIKPPE